MLTSVCADETSRTVGHGVVVVTSCVIDAGGMCVSFGRAVLVSGGPFSLFHVTRGDRKNGRDRFAKNYERRARDIRKRNRRDHGGA